MLIVQHLSEYRVVLLGYWAERVGLPALGRLSVRELASRQMPSGPPTFAVAVPKGFRYTRRC